MPSQHNPFTEAAAGTCWILIWLVLCVKQCSTLHDVLQAHTQLTVGSALHGTSEEPLPCPHSLARPLPCSELHSLVGWVGVQP